MKLPILLPTLLFVFFAFTSGRLGAADVESARIRHNVTVVVELPGKDGPKKIKLPWTVITSGQALECLQAFNNITFTFQVGELAKDSIDLNYTVIRHETGANAENAFNVRSYSEFKLGQPQQIDLGGQTITITLEPR